MYILYKPNVGEAISLPRADNIRPYKMNIYTIYAINAIASLFMC